MNIYNMLFRASNGSLVEIVRQDFKNDRAYYKKIMSVKRELPTVLNSQNMVNKFFKVESMKCT